MTMSTCNRSPFGAYAVFLTLAYTFASSPALAFSAIAVSALTPFRTRPACGPVRIPLCTCMVPSQRGSEPRNDPEGEGTHSYVEGLNFGSKEDEVLAKGGDPFFLTDDEDDDNSDAIDENGQEVNDGEASMPSMTFMSNMASMPGSLDVVGRGSTDSSSSRDEESSNRGDRISSIPFDGPTGAGGLHSRPEGDGFDEQKAALLDIGGDPFFLQEDGEKGLDVDEIKDEERFKAVDDDLWDGWVVEDAHLD